VTAEWVNTKATIKIMIFGIKLIAIYNKKTIKVIAEQYLENIL
jgi:hypothetical protein